MSRSRKLSSSLLLARSLLQRSCCCNYVQKRTFAKACVSVSYCIVLLFGSAEGFDLVTFLVV